MESRSSPQEQLDLLVADREALRGRAAYPFWYWAAWSLACNWWGLIAVIPDPPRWWIGLGQFLLLAVLLVASSRRRVRVRRPPLTWPTLTEWLVVTPLLLAQCALIYTGIRNDEPWLISTTAAVSTVALAAFAHRTQRVVFEDER
ncbi:hypothetical protein [Nocardioides euryhalodurans]|uniref:Uncharacterized protein n=1 Tax=Nocardioides euryhalodurans TaxID=2518370 RepID=A0A4P7GI65_9ACTN|nr:hypothetical protein [Nocardioides euryhalodurans]QBR91367.1 hypothetical protein EXE57_03095 [Nocardioides euryhalodurans]